VMANLFFVMQQPAFQIYGLRNFLLSDPLPELQRNRSDIDTLNESWQSDSENAFTEGAPHPERPGMIIDQVRTRIEVPGISYVHAVTAIGDSRGNRPTKIVSRSDTRTLDIGWDEFSLEYLTWEARWKGCTAVASTDIITTEVPHLFRDGDRVIFRALSGGTGITPASDSSLGAVYYVLWLSPTTFQVAASSGSSSPVDISTDMTAGLVIRAEFAKGTTHADYANMYLIDVRRSDDATDWQRVSVTYRGMMEPKPFKRIITCNQLQISTSDPISVGLPGGWIDPRYTAANLPKVVCTDTYLTTAPLATDEIPWSEDDGGAPPDPPDVRSISLSGDLTWNWPNGWSRLNEEHLDSIPLAGVNLKRRVSEYVWPAVFR
jgi:hypothetical protein